MTPTGLSGALLVCPRIPFPANSGGVKRTLRLAEAMKRAGVQVRILTNDQPEPGSLAALSQRGLGTMVFSRTAGFGRQRIEQHLRLLPGPRSPGLTGALLVSAHPSPAFVQLEGVIAASQLPRRPTPPLVFSTHNVEADLAVQARDLQPFGLGRLQSLYHHRRVAITEERTARRAACVLCVSDADADHFSRLAHRVVVAPNGVDREFFEISSPPEIRDRVLFFGQFTYAPNREGLLRFLEGGWPTLLSMRPGCQLMVAGEGSEETVGQAGRPDGVHALGLVDDIAATVASADLTLAPIWQGGGTRLKVLESLAGTRPVVGTSLGVSGIGFVSGRHGLVAESPREIAQAAAALLADPGRLGAMAAAGRQLALPFAWSQALAPAEELYAELLEARRTRSVS